MRSRLRVREKLRQRGRIGVGGRERPEADRESRRFDPLGLTIGSPWWPGAQFQWSKARFTVMIPVGFQVIFPVVF